MKKNHYKILANIAKFIKEYDHGNELSCDKLYAILITEYKYRIECELEEYECEINKDFIADNIIRLFENPYINMLDMIENHTINAQFNFDFLEKILSKY